MKTSRPNWNTPVVAAADRKRIELLAMRAVMDEERRLGFEARDVSPIQRGYDVELVCRDRQAPLHRSKGGRVAGAATVTVSRNEI